MNSRLLTASARPRPGGETKRRLGFAKQMGSQPKRRSSLCTNKKAYFDYEILEKYEAGIVLTGAEVKSVKEGRVQLKGSFASILNGRVIVENMHISPYRYSSGGAAISPLRRRELLLHKKEIDHLAGLSLQKGFTLVPLEATLKNNLIKILLGVCRGKKKHDKREVLKRRAVTREINQNLKKFAR